MLLGGQKITSQSMNVSSVAFFMGISTVAALYTKGGNNQALPRAGIFYTLIKTTEGFAMFLFIKQLFCFHQYDYESDIFRQTECRKCGKYKAD